MAQINNLSNEIVDNENSEPVKQQKPKKSILLKKRLPNAALSVKLGTSLDNKEYAELPNDSDSEDEKPTATLELSAEVELDIPEPLADLVAEVKKKSLTPSPNTTESVVRRGRPRKTVEARVAELEQAELKQMKAERMRKRAQDARTARELLRRSRFEAEVQKTLEIKLKEKEASDAVQNALKENEELKRRLQLLESKQNPILIQRPEPEQRQLEPEQPRKTSLSAQIQPQTQPRKKLLFI